jgi:AAA+ superfamily predicted ATPase
LVDDAILSRCTARVPYNVPEKEIQKRIWTILARANEVHINADEIAGIVEAEPRLSGRDIKNLLKLCILVSRDRNCRINAALVSEMKVFKPTMSEVEK